MHSNHVLALRLAPSLVLPRDLPPAPQASYIETSSSHRYNSYKISSRAIVRTLLR
jgi:hypothetical protein